MNLFKQKEIPSQGLNKEKKLKYKVLICAMLMMTIAGYIYFIEQDDRFVKNIFNRTSKKQIFVYLKVVQPLEERFYGVVNENVDLKDKCLYDDKKDPYRIKENIVAIDGIMIDLANVETNDFMLENKYLFLEEIEIMRDILLEKKLGIENNDVKSLIKANAYLEKYFLIGQIRRQVLKKIFDKYYIVYLELDNRIKYITK
ncbi:hypothetical protein [Marinisporobacter balticus]|uniref:Uncharacterized protein n=1 Tax=Marinisporobacter balticus TaxID=2018667 RepID=A0A4V2SCP1_9FIRM|nr:hypothetical protein [Marinisporobacter balticus]TCO80070.1 hypothetical protein EV214_101308 [Marinisporobacter balticus]